MPNHCTEAIVRSGAGRGRTITPTNTRTAKSPLQKATEAIHHRGDHREWEN
jgi:hypothetical protein